MTPHQTIDLTPSQAAGWIDAELAQAAEYLQAGSLDAALDGYVRALGLGLQLGPAPTERVLAAVLQDAGVCAQHQDDKTLSALGPALVGLVAQVREAEALPPTTVMDAWATIATDLGTIIGQVGLTLALPAERRSGMWDNAHARATSLDQATDNLFALANWLDNLQLPSST